MYLFHSVWSDGDSLFLIVSIIKTSGEGGVVQLNTNPSIPWTSIIVGKKFEVVRFVCLKVNGFWELLWQTIPAGIKDNDSWGRGCDPINDPFHGGGGVTLLTTHFMGEGVSMWFRTTLAFSQFLEAPCYSVHAHCIDLYLMWITTYLSAHTSTKPSSILKCGLLFLAWYFFAIHCISRRGPPSIKS